MPRAMVASMSFSGPERRKVERRQPPIVVRPTYAHIDTAALTHNLGVVRRRVGPRCRVLAVVKADGYGHGAIEAARALCEAGAWGLAVSLVEEGVELRQAGITAPVLVLGGVVPGSEDVLVHRSLTPVVWGREHLQRLASAVRRSGAPPAPVHLKIDTGMSRLGLLPSELADFLDWLEGDLGNHVRLEGVMTHLISGRLPRPISSMRTNGMKRGALGWAALFSTPQSILSGASPKRRSDSRVHPAR